MYRYSRCLILDPILFFGGDVKKYEWLVCGDYLLDEYFVLKSQSYWKKTWLKITSVSLVI